MEQLQEQIHRLEQKHLNELYSYIIQIFSNTSLPSHDAQHHLRVWLHCKEMIIELHRAGIEITEELIECAIIACFFHDSGLTIDIGEMHGKHGGLICKEYYDEHPANKPSNFDAIIQSIECHDDKSTKQAVITNPQDMACLNRLVSTADDLDAIGIIGIFRYIEIYLKRGIAEGELPKKIIANLKNRFTSFTNTYSSLHHFADKQKVHYLETINFFSNLDSQIIQGTYNPDSELAVYKTLKEQLVEQENSIDATIAYAQKYSTASYPTHFFCKLKKELDATGVTTAII
ncbi:MAG: hypothetical protein AB7S48_00220 [Bacteroidales bacterium]